MIFGLAQVTKCLSFFFQTVAQLDVHPTGDHELAGSTPVRSATFVCGD